MKNFFGKRATGLISTAVSATIVSSMLMANISAATVDLGTFTYPTSSSLGDVNAYMVFANELVIGNYSEGVFACKELSKPSGDAAGITDAVADYVLGYDAENSGGTAYTYIQSIADGSTLNNLHFGQNGTQYFNSLILPNDVTIEKTDKGDGTYSLRLTYKDGDNTYVKDVNSIGAKGAEWHLYNAYNEKDTTFQIDFDKAFKGLKEYSKAKVAIDTSTSETTNGKTTVTYKDGAGVDQNDYTITIDCVAGGNVVNVKAADLASHKIKVNGPSDGSDYSVVINVTDLTSSSYEFNKSISIDGGNENDLYGSNAQHVMFSFDSSYNGDLTFIALNQGIILAPNANVTVKSSHNGNVYANHAYNDGCEFHQNYFKDKSVNLKKGTSTPTGTATATATGTATATATTTKRATATTTTRATATATVSSSKGTTTPTATVSSTKGTTTPTATVSSTKGTTTPTATVSSTKGTVTPTATVSSTDRKTTATPTTAVSSNSAAATPTTSAESVISANRAPTATPTAKSETISANRTPSNETVTATGEGTSMFNVAALILICAGAVAMGVRFYSTYTDKKKQ